MSLFRKNDICVMGLGRFGQAVVKQLSKMNRYVMALDQNEKNVNAVASLANNVAVVDVSDMSALKGLGVSDFETVIVAMADNIDVAAAITELGVKNIVAKATSERHARILRQIGVDMIVLPEAEAGIKTALMVANPAFMKYSEKIEEIGGGFGMGSVVLHSNSWAGKDIMKLKFRHLGVNIVSIKRKTRIILPTGTTQLREGDLLTLIGPLALLGKAFKVLGKTIKTKTLSEVFSKRANPKVVGIDAKNIKTVEISKEGIKQKKSPVETVKKTDTKEIK